MGPYLKRMGKEIILEPNQQETVTLILDHLDYEEKLVDMAFIKITASGFVQETGQSFADEFDFRFNKPWIKIESQEMKVGEKTEANFTFPLNVPLTDCFFTMEVSGAVRPRTVRIDREVKPRERFTYSQVFVPRCGGGDTRRMVATFTSRQLADV